MDWKNELRFADAEITQASVKYAKSIEGLNSREIVLRQQGFEIGACWYKKHNGVYEGIAKQQAQEIVRLKAALAKEEDEVGRLLDLLPDTDKERQKLYHLSKLEITDDIIDKELTELNYDIEGSKTADFTDGFVRGFEYFKKCAGLV